MSDELPPASRFKISWLVGIAAAFAIFALIGAYSSRMTNDTAGYDDQRAEERVATLKKVQDTENALIYPVDEQGKPTAVWVDQAKGTIKIPIEEAMAKQIDLLKSQPAAQGCEIPGAAPATPAPAPAAATTNVAPATPAASTNAAPAAPTPPAKTNATTEPKPPAKPKK